MLLSSQALESNTVSASATSRAATLLLHQNKVVQEERFESSTASRWCLSRSKRRIDLMIALLVLGAFSLPMLAIGMCVRMSSKGPSLFVQWRVGRGGRLFRIYKFRSMTVCADGQRGSGLTKDGDSRITRLGYWLRKFKLDELPQFYNVLRGEMSLVGPRPKLPQYEAVTKMPYRPGITGAATLVFRCEEEMLSDVEPSHLDAYYNRHIRPLKARIDARYMSRATLWSDAGLIAATFFSCFMSNRSHTSLRSAPPRAWVESPQAVVTPLGMSAKPYVSGAYPGAD